MKKLFGGIKMGWGKVIIFAAIAGIYTGLIMLVSALDNTSFQDIGISYEWWVVFAVIIVVNCEKATGAALKCFVFFLISQPLVYMVEVLLGDLTPELAMSYYRNIWLPMTLLTLPGGFIAFFAKKETVFGGIVMGLGGTIEVIMGVFYAITAAVNFPYHILSAIFSFAAYIIMSVCIHREKKPRRIALVLPPVLTAAIIVFAKLMGLEIVSGVF